jgi:hypothetical protein
MLYLVFREDSNGVRYLMYDNLSREVAEERVDTLTKECTHRQQYDLLPYKVGERQAVLDQNRIQ